MLDDSLDELASVSNLFIGTPELDDSVLSVRRSCLSHQHSSAVFVDDRALVSILIT